ncbi:hypothetical protein NHX12_024291, partial [Muraenolepis orangiensis]
PSETGFTAGSFKGEVPPLIPPVGRSDFLSHTGHLARSSLRVPRSMLPGQGLDGDTTGVPARRRHRLHVSSGGSAEEDVFLPAASRRRE